MPELPEVETVCLALYKIVNNSKIINFKIFRKDLRWNIKKNLKKDLEKDIFKKPYRRGKYILIPTIRENILLIHLGMSGQIKIRSDCVALSKHDHIQIDIQTKKNRFYSIIYNDPRRFGYIDCFNVKEVESHFLLKKLGVEPLSDHLTLEYLKTKISKKSVLIKNILMDQSIIAGIGNIYASEILYKAKINPLRRGDSLNNENIKSIIEATNYILNKSISVGGTSIKNHLQPDGKLGYFVQELKVYGKTKQNCIKCDNVISCEIINNRSTYFCSNCQN